METVEPQLKNFSDVLESKSHQDSEQESNEKKQPTEGHQNLADINYVSPFKLPTDEEVFLYREREKQKKIEMKLQGSKTKIWDKKTASSKHQLNHYKKFEGEKDEQPANTRRKTQGYSNKDQTLIKAAMEVIKDRGKQREQIVKKEGVVELIEQKKEMFLVTMSHGILENEIERLKEIYREKKSALEQSEKIMEQDNEDFHRHWEQDKTSTEQAQHNAELASKDKKAKDGELKTLSVKLTSLQTDITRFDEQVSNSREHKEFLDKLASKEWHENKQKKRNEIIAKAKEAFIQRELQNNEDERDENESQNTYQRPGMRAEKKQVKNKSISSLRETAEEKFNQLLKDGEIDEVEEFENGYGMYFKEPHQLLDYFSMLEEKSLFLIQMSQDSEQNLEELKAEYKKKREDLEYKIKSLNETKNQKKKQLEELNKSIIQLKSQRDEHKQAKTKDELLGPISKKLVELFNQIKEKDEYCSALKLNTSNWTDMDNKSTMDILSMIEGIIRQFLKKIKEYKELNNEKVESMAKTIRSKRKKDTGDDSKSKLYELKKDKSSKERTETQKGKKHHGRTIMTRSAPADKEEVKEEEVVDNGEEEEKKFLE